MEKEKKSGIDTAEHHVLIAVEAVALWLVYVLHWLVYISRKPKQTTITSFDRHVTETI